MEHRLPDCQPRIESNTSQPKREHSPAMALRNFKRIDELAAGREFRDNHGDCLQYLDLVLKIMPQSPVLHDEDAEDPLAAQDRYAHQRVIDLFTGLRAIGETRMRLS